MGILKEIKALNDEFNLFVNNATKVLKENNTEEIIEVKEDLSRLIESMIELSDELDRILEL
jgi:hypothetical protein